MLGCLRLRFFAVAVGVVLVAARDYAVQPDAEKPDTEKSAAPVVRYVLNYPTAKEFCPPIPSYFDDTSATVQKVGGRTIRHPLNGGYGLPVVMKARDQNLLHVGADVGWNRAAQPMFAVAAGVVRISQPAPQPNVEKKSAAQHPASRTQQPMSWGNLIVIEHHLADGSYVTSIYGHLGPKRLVNDGDIVQAGQRIETVGKSGEENGGFKPHLHFGLREGRIHEPGESLFVHVVDGKPSPVKLVDLSETEVELRAEKPFPGSITLPNCEKITPTYRDGRLWISAAALNQFRRGDLITGYALSTTGWRDPTEFLLQMLEVFPRAPFGGRAPGEKDSNSDDANQLRGGQEKVAVDPEPAVAVAEKKSSKRPNIYNPHAEGKTLVKGALARAKKGEKRVLVMYGGNWCGWCYKLHELFNEDNDLRACLRRNYVLVMVDVDSEANKKFAAGYQVELGKHGLPYLTVLDSKGEVLAHQASDTFEDGDHHDPAKVLAFLEKYAAQPAAGR